MPSPGSTAKCSNLGDKSVAIEARPFPVIEMGSLRIPGAQHGAVVLRPLKRKIADATIAAPHDREEVAFRCPSRRRHLEDIAVLVAEAARRHRNAERER